MTNSTTHITLIITLLSGIATALLVVSFGTEEWVRAHGVLDDGDSKLPSRVNYGLFSGKLVPDTNGNLYYQIKITCLISENICAYLCGTSAKRRTDELNQLYKGGNVTFNERCPQGYFAISKVRVNWTKYEIEADAEIEDRKFLSAGLYISTALFLGIATLFGFLCTIFSIWISLRNPEEIYLTTYAISTYSIVASVGCVCSLILWATFYLTRVTDDVGILYTIVKEMSTRNMAYLGYSYWLILPSCVLYIVIIVLVQVKRHLANKEENLVMQSITAEVDAEEVQEESATNIEPSSTQTEEVEN